MERLSLLQRYLSLELAPVVNALALKNSLLANAQKQLDNGPVTCHSFLRFAGFDPSDEYWAGQVESIKSLYKIIANYSSKQREFLAFIIVRGKVGGSWGDERVSIFPNELDRLLNIPQYESAEYFRVLEADNIATYDSDEYPPKIWIHYVQDDVDFFVLLLKFCERDGASEGLIKRIIVDGDFTLLD